MDLRLIVVLIIASLDLRIVYSECGLKPCIRKCCRPGLALIPNSEKYSCKDFDSGFDIVTEKYEIRYESNCLEGKVPVAILADSFNFSYIGELILPTDNETVLIKPPNEYCINYTIGSDIISAVLCLDGEPDETSNYIGKFFRKITSSWATGSINNLLLLSCRSANERVMIVVGSWRSFPIQLFSMIPNLPLELSHKIRF